VLVTLPWFVVLISDLLGGGVHENARVALEPDKMIELTKGACV
jgi:hypothetical protein